jgi:RNA polymerase sigma factor (sigma-70 family)
MARDFMFSLIKNNATYLKSLALTLTGNHFDADDLYQTTLLKVLTHQDSFDVKTNFKAWSQTIMRNAFINEYRRKVRQQTRSVETPQQIMDAQASTSNVGYHNLNAEFIEHQIDMLDHTHKTIFRMYFQGFTYEEMSMQTDTPIPRLRSQVFVAKKMLQQRLKHTGMMAA